MSESLVAETCSGKVRGSRCKSVLGPEFYSFKGVPYAEPPIGQLRFADAVPIKPWSGVRDATSFGGTCAQVDFLTQQFVGSDDCLYLNVYTCGMNATKKLPVMVWIHGGAFVSGNGNDDLYGPDYFMAKDVVLVTINYRLGVLGFLCLDDEAAPGNQGLKDQVMALKWVRDNIANFGGDPDNVTIFGESAGGASVHYLTISPLSRGLIHKAIAQSGVAINTWAYQTDPKSKAYQVCERLGFKSRDPKEIVNFLKTVDCKTLIDAQEASVTAKEKIQFTFPFGPAVDAKSKTPFMPVPVEEAAKEGAQVPLIIGYNNLEGGLFAKYGMGNYDKLDRDLEKYLHPESVKLLNRYKQTVNDLRHLYYQNEKISDANVTKSYMLMGDLYFTEGIHRIAKMQVEAGTNPTYLYRLTYDKVPSIFKGMLNINVPGAIHGDDIPYLFRARQLEGTTHDFAHKGVEGYKVMERLVNLWVNFAKTGRPTPSKTEDVPFYWTPLNNGTVLRYLNIDENLQMEVGLNLQQHYSVYKVTKNKL